MSWSRPWGLGDGIQLIRVASSLPLGLTSKYGFVKIFKKWCLQLQCRRQGLNLVEI